MVAPAKISALKTAVDDLNRAAASGYGNLPAKELAVKHRLVDAIEDSQLKTVYSKIYEDCFPYGEQPNLDLLSDLACDGMLKNTSKTLTYWGGAFSIDLGV